MQGGFARAATSLAGTALVVGSFIAGRLANARQPHSAQADSGFAPLKIVELDLARPLQPITGSSPDGSQAYAGAYLVVRDNRKLVAVTQVPLYGQDLSPAVLAPILAQYGRAEPSPAHPALPRTRVVVATRDRTASLARCLDSLLVQDHPDFEIVVVDNAPSNDETRLMVRERYEPTGRVTYFREDRPGLSNAHNRGLDGVTAEVVAFTDDDVVADIHWLSSLVQPFAESAEVACVTGSILPAELETRAQYWTELHGGFLKSVERQDFDLGAHRPNNPLFPYAAGMFGSGANMAFRLSALRETGFDPALGAGTIARGGDDLAAFADIVLAGHRLVFNPDALVWHYHRRSEDGLERQAYGYGMGLGAYLTRLVASNPVVLARFAVAAPAGLAHIFGRNSAKNARLPGDYPSSLIWRERLGMLAGIPAYFRSRKAVARPADTPSAGSFPRPAWKST